LADLTHDGAKRVPTFAGQVTGFRPRNDQGESGDRLLVAGPNGGAGLSGFVLVDVSDPANPERVAVHLTSHAIHNAYLDGDTAYLTDSSRGRGPVVVVDGSDDDPGRRE
jgi:hypothetical protein